jgi:ech hydrogenase subunit B
MRMDITTALPEVEPQLYWQGALAFLLLGPLIGGLLAGFDRIFTARMQGRKGPPLFQPFYDVLKLLEKEPMEVNRMQNLYLWGFLVFTILAGMLLFAGGNLLIGIFIFTVGGIMLVLGAYSSHSPYSHAGAEREMLQMMAYEPMVLIAIMGLYMVAGSFEVSDVLSAEKSALVWLPGIFLGFLYILTIKLRKSPFDLSCSHHGHQEIVKGLTTDFGGRQLALVEIAHFYEYTLLLGLLYLFFAFFGLAIALPAALLAYFLEVLVDNTHARLKWQFTVASSWVVATVLGGGNLLALEIVQKWGGAGQ